MLESVRRQGFADWELCVCTGPGTGSRAGEELDRAAAGDPRIRLARLEGEGGMATSAAEALAMARGDFVALLGEVDRLHPAALASVDAALRSAPEADFAYTDEDEIEPGGRHCNPFFKPGWSPERLRTQMYTGRLTAMRRSLVEELGGFDRALDRAAAEWDLVLRVTERARAILRVPRTLYHRMVGVGAEEVGGKAPAAATVEAVQAHCERIGLAARVEAAPGRQGGCRLQPALPEAPPVSIVIPTCGQSRAIRGKDTVLLLHCVRSILETSTYDRYEIVCVADTSTDPSILGELQALAGDRLRIVPYGEPFNFSAKINLGAAQSEGEHFLLFNDDMEVFTPDWIARMVMYSSFAGIGAVGAQLRWENERVQHAGVVLERGLPGHVYRGAGPELEGYARNALVTQDYLAVTGACLMTPRDAFERVGGLSEELPVNYNDIDYCLKLVADGLRVVYDADTVLYHFESSSRETKVNDWEKSMLLDRWHAIGGEDPYSNPSLRYGEPRAGLLRRASRLARARLSLDR
jgi:O-antigen biosynthesis protein